MKFLDEILNKYVNYLLRIANTQLVAKVLRLGLEIDGNISLKNLGLHPSIANEHAPTNDYIELFYLLLKVGIWRKRIVDLGCGSGAALALFRFLPFDIIYGVELSFYLSERARKNFGKRVKIYNDDARNFNELVDIVYIFNPFPRDILLDALSNILKKNLKVVVIYRNPVDFIEIKKNFRVDEFFKMKSSTSDYICFLLKR